MNRRQAIAASIGLLAFGGVRVFAAAILPLMLAFALFAGGLCLLAGRWVYDVASNGGRQPEYLVEKTH